MQKFREVVFILKHQVYKSLMDIKSSKLVAMNGLVENKIVQGENGYFKFAYKNFELNPNLQVIEKLYDLQIKGKRLERCFHHYIKTKICKITRNFKRKEAIFL